MLIVKGRTASFDLVDGDKIDAPSSAAMLHDPSGRYWKKTSVLFVRFERSNETSDGDKYSKDYLGHSHLTHVGDVKLPPRALSSWKYEGEVTKIWYTRTGKKNGGKRFVHKMNQFGLQKFFRGRGKARLYSRGDVYRLELPPQAHLDSRGFVWP